MECITIDRLEKLADCVTHAIMSYMYGSRFSTTDDITTDEEMSASWDELNEIVFTALSKNV